MQNRKASIKETGEELSPAEWERFDLAVAEVKAERRRGLADGSDESAKTVKAKTTQAETTKPEASQAVA